MGYSILGWTSLFLVAIGLLYTIFKLINESWQSRIISTESQPQNSISERNVVKLGKQVILKIAELIFLREAVLGRTSQIDLSLLKQHLYNSEGIVPMEGFPQEVSRDPKVKLIIDAVVSFQRKYRGKPPTKLTEAELSIVNLFNEIIEGLDSDIQAFKAELKDR